MGAYLNFSILLPSKNGASASQSYFKTNVCLSFSKDQDTHSNAAIVIRWPHFLLIFLLN